MTIHLNQERKPHRIGHLWQGKSRAQDISSSSSLSLPGSHAALDLGPGSRLDLTFFSRRAINAIFYSNENSPPTPSTAFIIKHIFVQSSSTHCSSLDIHRYCLHATKNLAMWRRKLIKQQTPNISSTRDLVDKSLPCSSPPPPWTTGKNPSQLTAHFVMYMVASPLCCVNMQKC